MAKGNENPFDAKFSEYLDELEKSKIKRQLKGKRRGTVLKMQDGRVFKLGLFGRVVRVK